MQRKTQCQIQYVLLGGIFVFSSLLNFQLDGRTFFLWLQIAFCVYMAYTSKTLIILPYKSVNVWFISVMLCTVGALFSGMPYSWVKAAVVMAIYMIPFYFSLSYLDSQIKEEPDILRYVIKGIKIMCIIQLLWIPLQYIAYHYLGMDLNRILFYDVLHMTKSETGMTFIRDWRWYPSGMTWHSAILAPVFLLALILFKNPFVKCLTVFDVLICGNSTALVCVIICLCLQFFFCIYRGPVTIKKNELILLLVMMVVAIIAGCTLDLFSVLAEAIVRLVVRLMDINSDASTAAHFAYFADYSIIAEKIPAYQLLFGTGLGSSGYQYSLLYERYTDLANWAVECDVVDILVSKGFFGFLVHYGLLAYIAIKGAKIDFRYLVFVLPIIIGGIGYNIQFDYVLMIEMVFYTCIKRDIDFFAFTTRV